MTKKIVSAGVLCLALLAPQSFGEESLFTPDIIQRPLVKKMFSFIEQNREKIIEEWIFLTEVPSPSGHEEKRAAYMKQQFEAAGLDKVYIDQAGNAVGIWKGSEKGKKIVIPAHMDTVFQDVWEIRVKREGNVLKAPGIGDDTASLINLLWSIRALKEAGFKPVNTYYFLGTVEEETGFVGMRAFMEKTTEKIDLVIALDGDLGGVHYGALGFGGGRVVFRGPGAHTMLSRGIPNPNLAVAKAIERIYRIGLFAEPLERWAILNVGIITGGKVRNAVSQESSFTIDLRSPNQDELKRVQAEIKTVCRDVADEEGVKAEISLNEQARAFQIPGARNSFLVKTVVDILDYLNVRGVVVDPLGSTDANVGIERGILSVNLGRTYGRFKHSLREEADIHGLFLALKQVVLLLVCLDEPDDLLQPLSVNI
ncbi:MAG: M20/M25/M40 family metallo-hydrolase [Candidatus Aminicenantes bacterium]|jgi:acetylornithine deacetylase/succinyl-diaminopimelate desuccinylase-like protein